MIRATSAAGDILFGGKEELYVYRYLPLSGDRLDNEVARTCGGTVVSAHVFLLHTADGASSKGPRHLREIEDVKCTSCGSHAVVRCSDGTVFMYSVSNIFGSGVPPSSSRFCDPAVASLLNPENVDAELRPHGFLSFLFKTNSVFDVETAVTLSGDGEVTLSIAWQLHMSPQSGGAIHCQRILTGAVAAQSFYVPASAVEGYIESSCSSSCCICGSTSGNHWERVLNRASPPAPTVKPNAAAKAPKALQRYCSF